MSSKQKGHGSQAGHVAREKGNQVAPDSLQTRAPGAVERGSANVQSANKESGTVPIRGERQDVYGASEQGERGGPGAQQSVWSSRQQAERMEARAEEERRAAEQSTGGKPSKPQAGGSNR